MPGSYLTYGVTPGIHTGRDGATVIGRRALQVDGARRIEPGLRNRPLVTLELVGRGLLVALPITRIGEDIRHPTAEIPWRRRRGGHRRALLGRRRSHDIVGIRRRWRVILRLHVVALLRAIV